METSQSHAATARPRASGRSLCGGFSLVEILIAITILSVGLCALAGLVAQSLTGTERARFMAVATTLASEKLEDLNRWPSTASQVSTFGNTSVGSLSSDSASNGNHYYDDVDLSNTNGEVSETVATSSGYSSVDHFATGVVTPNNNAAAPTGTGTVAFHRRWLIEANPVIGGVTLTGSRRVTVLVTMSGQKINFQLSTVRP
jgi:prepilin-type N-terminal cleavage/methylation domain-containing protein